MADDVLDFTAPDECATEEWDIAMSPSASRWHRLYDEDRIPSARKPFAPSEQQFRRKKLAKYRVFYEPTLGAIRLETELEARFRRLADEWRRETGHYSLTFKRAMHPAYQQIIGMGKDALPLILRDLQERPTGHWFWALRAISGEDPARLEEDIDSAIHAWVRWGREHRYL